MHFHLNNLTLYTYDLKDVHCSLFMTEKKYCGTYNVFMFKGLNYLVKMTIRHNQFIYFLLKDIFLPNIRLKFENRIRILYLMRNKNRKTLS